MHVWLASRRAENGQRIYCHRPCLVVHVLYIHVGGSTCMCMFWFRCARKCTFILHSRSTWLHIYVYIIPYEECICKSGRPLRLRRAMINHRENAFFFYVAASLLLLATVRSFHTRNTAASRLVMVNRPAGYAHARRRLKGVDVHMCMHDNLYWQWHRRIACTYTIWKWDTWRASASRLALNLAHGTSQV
jgi:hypothetical protein